MRIAVRGTNWIGDAVMAAPALRRLRSSFPDAHIALHTRGWAEGIFRDSQLFDEIVSISSGGSRLSTTLKQSAELKAREYDIALLLTNSFASAFVARLAGVPRRFGYSTDGRSFLLTDPVVVPEWKKSRHEVYYYLNLVEALERSILGTSGPAAGDAEPKLDISVGRRLNAMQTLAAHNIDATRTTVALAVGSTNSRAKRWTPEYFARLNDKLQDELGANVILVGSKEEADVAAEVSAMCLHRPFDMTGRTDLSEAAAILSEIDLLIANDMGLAHLAPAVGTHTIVIFGPTDPTTTRPNSRNAEIIRAGVECSPCMLRDCPIDHRCMTRVLPDDVFERARTALGR